MPNRRIDSVGGDILHHIQQSVTRLVGVMRGHIGKGTSTYLNHLRLAEASIVSCQRYH